MAQDFDPQGKGEPRPGSLLRTGPDGGRNRRPRRWQGRDMATGLLVRALGGVAGVWVLSRLDNSIPQSGPEDAQARRDRPRGSIMRTRMRAYQVLGRERCDRNGLPAAEPRRMDDLPA